MNHPTSAMEFLKVMCTATFYLIGLVNKIEGGQLLEEPINLGALLHPDYFIDALRVKSCGGYKYTWTFVSRYACYCD